MEKAVPTSTLDELPPHQRRARLGAFYTPKSAAEFMAQWLIRERNEEVLEPCFGEGVFLKAVAEAAKKKDVENIRIHGVEVDPQTKSDLNEEQIGDIDRLIRSDFLELDPFAVDAVIGNPPYVRLRELSDDQQDTALRVASFTMGEEMDSSGSTWMPFVLHSMRFLKTGGRMALVLPYDFTYVKYARPLWKVLGKKFGQISVLHSYERMFPDVQQDVVVLMADEFGAETRNVEYSTYKSVDGIRNADPIRTSQIPIDKIWQGEKCFVKSLLDKETINILEDIFSRKNISKELVKFKIGYVSANKDYFHPAKKKIDEYNIEDRSLRRSVNSSKSLSGIGVRTSNIEKSNTSMLFLPDPSDLTEGDKEYIEMGKNQEVHKAYKCERRTPWYRVPRVDTPDIILSVFSDVPVAVENDAGLAASNSLLCGYLRNGASAKQVLMGWYTSLLRIQMELEVHSLGGGVLVAIPGEADELRLPDEVQPSSSHLKEVDSLLREGRFEEAYMHGDDRVLREALGMSKKNVNKIREGVKVLRKWRNSH